MLLKSYSTWWAAMLNNSKSGIGPDNFYNVEDPLYIAFGLCRAGTSDLFKVKFY